MKKIIDISMQLYPNMVQWPGSSMFEVKWTDWIQNGDPVNNSFVTMDTHCGTHIDASLHHLENGTSIDKIPLEIFIGPVYVADICGVPVITSEILDSLKIPIEAIRVLFKTDNSLNRNHERFDENFVAFSQDAAYWIANSGIRLLGIDYLSIQRYNSSDNTHKILLEADVVIVEGIDLNTVEQGWYDLVCLPLRLIGLEGAPARAILIREPEEQGNE